MWSLSFISDLNIIFEIEVINTEKSMPVKPGICKNFFLSVRDFADKSYNQYLHLNFIITQINWEIGN